MAELHANIEQAIRDRIELRMREIMVEEADKVKGRVLSRIAGEIDKLALELLDYYDIARDSRGLTITVRKQALSATPAVSGRTE